MFLSEKRAGKKGEGGRMERGDSEIVAKTKLAGTEKFEFWHEFSSFLHKVIRKSSCSSAKKCGFSSVLGKFEVFPWLMTVLKSHSSVSKLNPTSW